MIRLQKYLADCGVASRRKSENLITDGRVSVNGKILTELGTKINPEKDSVTVDGKAVNPEKRLIYIMLHKPEGVITSVKDPHGRLVVTDLINISERVFPAGRLDYDSSGLVLLTNDGDLVQKLTHPSNMIKKTYIARLRSIPDKDAVKTFCGGLQIDGGAKTAPCELKILDKKNTGCTALITIHEGRNRQIRKMCDAIGCPVAELKRISIGTLKLGDLQRGKYRHLTDDEVRSLK